MKILFKGLLLFVLMVSCQDHKSKESSPTKKITHAESTQKVYPKSISKVFNAHGGLDLWHTMQKVSFTIEKPNGKEVTTTHLKTRKERIETPDYTIGFDGDSLWLDEKKKESYKGNAKFYKGLMLYFYAMPFILSDNGIIYKPAMPLIFEGETYPGIQISYEAGVGASPNDEYILYYDAQTGQMQWLAYTVTFGKNTKSKDFHFIRYNNWQPLNGLLLPKSMDWFDSEHGQPTSKRRTIEFTDLQLSQNPPDESYFLMPENAKSM